MEVASIKGDTILLLYHPSETAADVGQQFTILESPDHEQGLVIQVISNDSLEYAGLQQEMIQKILETQIAQVDAPINREQGMGEIKSLKVAKAKIRKRIQNGTWVTWDGWIPTRNVQISRIEGNNLLGNVLPTPIVPLRQFAQFNGSSISFDGPRLNMVNVVTGVKGSGKSHLAKHLVIALAEKGIPCVIFDVNGEYVELPNAQVLRWGENFIPDLAEVGHDMLSLVIRAVYPLPANSESVLDGMLPVHFGSRRTFCRDRKQPFTIDLDYLQGRTWSNNNYVQDAIADRLRVIANMGLFLSPGARRGATITNFATIYENAWNGNPVVFDMRALNNTLRSALVKSVNQTIENICQEETNNATERYPFVFFEEAHFYVSASAILNLITRGRHIGMASVFVTNTPQELPDTVFRQLDNLFLLSLSHKDDIRNVSKNSFTDEETIQSFATRMPKYHALIMGNVTERYPLIVKVDDLPSGVPTSGRTKSTWDRFIVAAAQSLPENDEDDIPF